MRITVKATPEKNEATRVWLQKHVGSHNYASAPKTLWSSTRAVNIYFRDLHTAVMFVAGCPHITLIGERYEGPMR